MHHDMGPPRPFTRWTVDRCTTPLPAGSSVLSWSASHRRNVRGVGVEGGELVEGVEAVAVVDRSTRPRDRSSDSTKPPRPMRS